MSIRSILLPLLGASLLAGCDGAAQVGPVNLLVPTPGRYQATLTGYRVRGCPAALGEPVGTLDASAQFGFYLNGRLDITGGRLWPFGAVPLRAGDRDDPVSRLSWIGSSSAQAERAGCLLAASVTAQYFPLDEAQGTLHLTARYASVDGRCALPLPCEDGPIWSLVAFE